MIRRSSLAITLLFLLAGIVGAQQRAPKVALVLSGGGARGIAQVGVLKELERHGIVPDVIVGTSFGAIVGGLYAAGYSADQLDSIFRRLDWDELSAIKSDTKRKDLFFTQKKESDRSLITLRFRDFSFLPPRSISGSAHFATQLQQLIWRSPYNTETDFDSLRYRFRAVATDLSTGTWVALSSGNLATALQASAMFPLRFSPVHIGDRVLVDGGLAANIPVEAAEVFEPDITIVVNTVSKLLKVSELEDAIDVADQALTVAMNQSEEYYLSKADFVIEPELTGIGTFDFEQVNDMISQGATAMRSQGKEILMRIREVRNSIAKDSPAQSMEQRDSLRQSTFIRSASVVSSFDVRADSVVDSLITDMSGRGWSSGFYKHYKHKLLLAIRSAGFTFAFIRSMTYDESTQTVTVHIDRGEVSNIEISSERPIKMSDVTPELTFFAGDSVSAGDLDHTADNLRASDLFDDVDLTLTPAPDSGLNVVVGATDRGNQVLKLGGRIDNERFTQVGVHFIQQNLFSTGARLDVGGYISQRIGSADITFEIPRISNTLWKTMIRGYASFRNVWIYGDKSDAPTLEPERERIGEFSEDRLGFRINVGRQLERNGEILGEFRYEEQRYRDLSGRTMQDYKPLSTIRGVVRWDDRDKVDFASSGRVIDILFESTLLNLSDGLSFTKLSVNASYVIPAGNFAFTPRVYAGAADKTLPNPELFSLGGQDLFFGMREDEERGRQIVVGNFNAQYKLPFAVIFDTYISARYDVGAVWEIPEKIKVGDLQHGLGLTIGFDTPVGPANFSLGRRFYFLKNPDAVAWGPILGYFAIGVRL